MEKCWNLKRRRVELLVWCGFEVPLSVGVITLSIFVLAWMKGEYALNPILAYAFFAVGIGISVEIIIGGSISIGMIVLSLISIAALAGAFSQYAMVIVYACLGLGFGFVLFTLILHGIIGPVELTREYELSDQGITIQYLGRFRRLYSWDSIRKICICTVFRTSDRLPGTLVIWCTLGKIHKEPPKGNRISWNQPEYTLMHFRSVLLVEYSPERLEEFQKYSKREIPDYRDL